MSVRLPDVRHALLREVRVLRGALAEIDEVELGDAVEEAGHLLDPHHGEPGDILLNDDEVARATALWAALDRARWPADRDTRASDPAWNSVVQRAAAFLEASQPGF